MCRRVGEDDDSVAEVARAFGVGWHAAMTAVDDHGRPLVEDPARTDGVERSGWTRPSSSRPHRGRVRAT